MGMNIWDALDVQRTPRWKKILASRGNKVYLGLQTRPGWTDRLPFYLFKCPNCQKIVEDYSHGFPEKQYLLCPECRERIDFVRFWTGVKMFFSFIHLLFKLRLTKRSHQKAEA